MCFSATASWVSAASLAGAGVWALGRVTAKSQRLFACIPLLFAMQQTMEGMIWMALTRTLDGDSGRAVTYWVWGYSLFSQVVSPVYVPLAVAMMEPLGWRKTAIWGGALAGAAVSMLLLTAMLSHPVTAQIQGLHIAYRFSHAHEMGASLLYLIAVCGAPLASSHPAVRLFGLAVLATALWSYGAYASWFISVWCFFASLISVLVLVHLHPKAQIAMRRWLKSGVDARA